MTVLEQIESDPGKQEELNAILRTLWRREDLQDRILTVLRDTEWPFTAEAAIDRIRNERPAGFSTDLHEDLQLLLKTLPIRFPNPRPTRAVPRVSPTGDSIQCVFPSDAILPPPADPMEAAASSASPATTTLPAVPLPAAPEIDQAVDQSVAPVVVAAAAPKGSGKAARTLPFRTALEIARTTPIEVLWLVVGFLVVGAATELIGKIKLAGKTTFISRMVRCVVDGLPFLGQPTVATPVVWLTEQPASSFRETLKRADLLDRDDVHILHHHDVMEWSWPKLAAEVVAEAVRLGARIIIVDTLSRFTGLSDESENSAGDAEASVLAIVGPAVANGIAVLLSRHERKSGGDIVDAGRGSSAITGVMDIVISLRRPDNTPDETVRVIRSVGRFDDLPDGLLISLTPEGYVLLGGDDHPVANANEAKVLAALGEDPTSGLTLEDLVTGTEIRRTTVQGILKKLERDELVDHAGDGTKGKAKRFFRRQLQDDGDHRPDVAADARLQAPQPVVEPAPKRTATAAPGDSPEGHSRRGTPPAASTASPSSEPSTQPLTSWATSVVQGPTAPVVSLTDAAMSLMAITLVTEIHLREQRRIPRMSVGEAVALLQKQNALGLAAADQIIKRFDGIKWRLVPGNDRNRIRTTLLEKTKK